MVLTSDESNPVGIRFGESRGTIDRIWLRIKAEDEMREALHIQLKVLPSWSDKNPIIGPPATPPISNKVDNSPDTKDV